MSELITASFEEDLANDHILIDINGDLPFHGASLSKLFMAAATLCLVEGGQISLNKRLPLTLTEYSAGKYGTGVLKEDYFLPALMAKHFGWNMPSPTLETLLRLSLSHSDNMATLKLANAIGRSRIQAVISDWGLSNTTILNHWFDATNTTTAEDVGHFLKDLAFGTNLEDFDLAQKMLGWLPRRDLHTHSGHRAEIRLKMGCFTEDGFRFHHAAGFIFLDKTNDFQTFCYLTKAEDEGEKTVLAQTEYLENAIWLAAYQLPRRKYLF